MCILEDILLKLKTQINVSTLLKHIFNYLYMFGNYLASLIC